MKMEMEISDSVLVLEKREQRIRLICLVIATGFLLSILFHIYQGIWGNQGYPYNTFLFRPDDHFMDFYNSYRHVVDRMPYQSNDYSRIHMPFTQAIHYLFSRVDSGLSLLIFTALFTVFTSCYCARFIVSGGIGRDLLRIFSMTVLSYPFLFEIDRSHIEAVTFIFLALFINYYAENKHILSIIFLGAAIAMKPYNMVYLLLLAGDKKYRQACYVFTISLLLNFLSLLVFKGGIINNLRIMSANIQLNNKLYTVTNEGIFFGHSLFGAIKELCNLIYRYDKNTVLSVITSTLQPYFYFTMVIFLLISAYILFIEQSYWKKVSLLCISTLVLPYISYDMRLINLYVPLMLFIGKTEDSKFDTVYSVLLALLFIPKDYWHDGTLPEISSSVFLTPLIMVILTLLIMTEGFKRRANRQLVAEGSV